MAKKGSDNTFALTGVAGADRTDTREANKKYSDRDNKSDNKQYYSSKDFDKTDKNKAD